MTAILGIDLGTTYSLCSLFRDGKPQLIPNVHGSFLTPSAVGILESGDIIVGASAREFMVAAPDRCAAWFKRGMGTDRIYLLAGREFSAQELSSLVLRSLKADAESFLGEIISEAVISVPAYFTEHQRKMTKVAGELAGLTVRRIINEPSAAALVHGMAVKDSDRKILVFDLGGGTFDVTIMEIFEGTLEIIATSGESFLGGEDFTDRIAAWALRKKGLHFERLEHESPKALERLRVECEIAKRALTLEDSFSFAMPGEDGVVTPDSPRITITASDFSEVIADLVRRIEPPVRRALADADCGIDQISDIILVGGATRMRCVREFVERLFKKPPLFGVNPDEAVALGAAVQAALLAEDAAVQDIVMTDVCPHTLGVAISKQLGPRIVDGYYLPVIHRNTTIPVSQEEILSTLHANQNAVNVRVYQGEARKVEENLYLGELLVSDLPPGPAGVPIHVRFTYDCNGILEVEAHVPDTGRKFRTVLTHSVKGLSDEDIKKALRRMRQLKFYPRDLLANKELLFFSERVLKEVPPQVRQILEEAMDMFESAMDRNDRAEFENARRNLLETLERIGHPYSSTTDAPGSEDDHGNAGG